MIELKRKLESNNTDLLKDFVDTWNFHLNHPRMEVVSPNMAIGNGHTTVCVAELENGIDEIHLRTFKKIKDEWISMDELNNL